MDIQIFRSEASNNSIEFIVNTTSRYNINGIKDTIIFNPKQARGAKSGHRLILPPAVLKR